MLDAILKKFRALVGSDGPAKADSRPVDLAKLRLLTEYFTPPLPAALSSRASAELRSNLACPKMDRWLFTLTRTWMCRLGRLASC